MMRYTEALMEERLQKLLVSMDIFRWNSQPHPVYVREFTRVHNMLEQERAKYQ